MTKRSQHTMTEKDTLLYCKSKIHSLFRDTDVAKISIVPTYDRTKSISDTVIKLAIFMYFLEKITYAIIKRSMNNAVIRLA